MLSMFPFLIAIYHVQYLYMISEKLQKLCYSKININKQQEKKMTETSNPDRVALIVENTIELNGRQIESNQKVYLFSSVDAAEKFADKLMEIPQGENSDNLVRVSIVDYVVDASDDAEPVLLHSAYYDHGDDPEDGNRVLEDIDVLTVEEIEDFRSQGIKSNIVKAFDNPDLLEPSDSEVEPDYLTRFELVGLNLFQDDKETDFFLSFDSEITPKLYAKFGDSVPAKSKINEFTREDWDKAYLASVQLTEEQGRDEYISAEDFIASVVKLSGCTEEAAQAVLEELQESGFIASVPGKGLRHPVAVFLEEKNGQESGVRQEDVERRQDFVNFAQFLKAEPAESE